MSQRTLIEISHDMPVPKTDAELLAWAKSISMYIDGATKDILPENFKVFWRRNHTDPCPFENPLDFERRYGRIAKTLEKHQ